MGSPVIRGRYREGSEWIEVFGTSLSVACLPRYNMGILNWSPPAPTSYSLFLNDIVNFYSCPLTFEFDDAKLAVGVRFDELV
ncbi:hypothetical protein QCA50_007374 [Cerrena zonata]|uniref:Uncharacterized protein n=1 Tax=Cerrena zonata TaxID=2478898 RepID=A0AAW0GDG0_9APHY